MATVKFEAVARPSLAPHQSAKGTFPVCAYAPIPRDVNLRRTGYLYEQGCLTDKISECK